MPATAEIWLRTNLRAYLVMLGVVGALTVVVASFLIWSVLTEQNALVAIPIACFSLVLFYFLALLAYAMKRPRLAYGDGTLFVYADQREPEHVPIDIVEVFFLGQGPSELPKIKGREPETQNVIIRLAESATEWKHRDMKPAIGMWCEGYITIRGSWCEPITPEIMRQLNHRLIEIQRERKAARQVTGAAR